MSQLLDTSQVARKLSLSKETVRTLASQGKLPVVRLARRKLLFSEEAIEAMVKRSSGIETRRQ